MKTMMKQILLSAAILEDTHLSLKAKGAYTLLKSVPTWSSSVRQLTELTSDGTYAVHCAIKELEENGYLERIQNREDGRFAEMEYVLRDGSEYDKE